MNYSGCPEVLQKFITYIDTIKGKSKKTAEAYYFDLQTFFRYIKVAKNICPTPKNFNSSNTLDAIDALKEIDIADVNIALIKTITLDDLYEYMAYLNRTRGNSPYARARKVASLKTFFKYLHSNVKLIDNNPAELLTSPKIGKILPKHLDLDSSKNLLNAVNSLENNNNKERDYLILTLFLNCGMRLSELVNINISDIRGNTIIVTGKGNKQRTIYLNKACLSALDSYKSIRETIKTNERALFLNNHSQRLGQRGVQNIVKKYLQLAGLDTTKYSTHKLRHTAATLMYQHGNVDIRVLQEILGHEHLSTTEIYTHIDEQRLRNAVDSNPLADIEASD